MRHAQIAIYTKQAPKYAHIIPVPFMVRRLIHGSNRFPVSRSKMIPQGKNSKDKNLVPGTISRNTNCKGKS